jgi:hypothetical protein
MDAPQYVTPVKKEKRGLFYYFKEKQKNIIKCKLQIS